MKVELLRLYEMRNAVIDKAEMEAYDKIATVTNRDPPSREQDLAEHVEAWLDIMEVGGRWKWAQVGTGIQDQGGAHDRDGQGQGVA